MSYYSCNNPSRYNSYFWFRTGNETSVDVSVDPHHSSPGNLRDEFLKSELSDNLRQDSDLDGHVGTNDIQRFMGTPSPKLQTPKIFSKSVTIRSVRRPDGVCSRDLFYVKNPNK